VKKTIILTGATGYLGSCLAKALIAKGHKLIILKRKNSSLFRIKKIIPMIVSYNIENLDYSVPFKAHGKIDAVIHTATCYARDGETTTEVLEANIKFPLRLMDAAQADGVSTFINTDTILNKNLNLYSLSKKQLLEWGKYFSIHNEMFFVNMKLEHFYGPEDKDSKFIMHVINSCIKNVPELKLTLGEQRRDFIYIEDVISAYLVILDKLEIFTDFFNEFHIGTGTAISIRDLTEKIHFITNSQTNLAFGNLPYRKGEVMISEANIEPLLELGWSCKTNLEEGLKLVIESFKL